MVGFPAARKGDPVTHDLLVPSGVIGPPVTGPCPMGQVMIENLPAAHVMCTVVCSGATSLGPAHPPLPIPPAPPPPITTGAASVLIHNMPAARWAPSGDIAVCGVFLGDPKLVAMRTVLIGGPAATVAMPTVAQRIVDEAKKYLESNDWSYYTDRPPYGPGTNKCNLFVYEVLNNAGAPVPMKERWSWRNFEYVKYPPLAGQWADPDVDIPGWVVVDDPQPGDVVAMEENYSDASGHVGIVSGEGKTISASSETQTIVENDWGFREGQKPVFRRYVGE
jgi:cell wall-associated NlpC family hydrolase